jgi:hypothetical protein
MPNVAKTSALTRFKVLSISTIVLFFVAALCVLASEIATACSQSGVAFQFAVVAVTLTIVALPLLWLVRRS